MRHRFAFAIFKRSQFMGILFLFCLFVPWSFGRLHSLCMIHYCVFNLLLAKFATFTNRIFLYATWITFSTDVYGFDIREKKMTI